MAFPMIFPGFIARTPLAWVENPTRLNASKTSAQPVSGDTQNRKRPRRGPRSDFLRIRIFARRPELESDGGWSGDESNMEDPTKMDGL